MRRRTMLVLGLLLACSAFPATARAQPQNLPQTLFGIISKPIGAIFGTVRRIGRGPAVRPPAPIRSRSAGTGPSQNRQGADTSTATARAAGVAAPAVAGVGAAAAAATTEPGSVPIPSPRQRNASLAQPGAEGKTPFRPGRDGSKGSREQSQLGLVGPLAWPSAYEDVLGFALWPRAYVERLRLHGLTDVLTTIFAPPSMPSAPVEMARASAGEVAAANGADAAPVGACQNAVKTSSNWPAAQIERWIELTEPQRDSLRQLRTAIVDATKVINATCRDEVAQSPVERLRVMQNQLWAVRDAAILVRAPLASFINSLTDAQKQKFSLPASQADPRAAMAGRPLNRQALARMCGMPPMNDSSLQPIERTLQPTKSQQASLETMQKKSFEMGQFLMASCLQPMPLTPTERLDFAIDRLTAVVFAASTINLAFNDFFNQLSDQQKTKLEAFAQ